MDDEYHNLKKWAEEHVCACLYDVGLLETYIFMFNCDGCPSPKLTLAYQAGLERIKLVINGNCKFKIRQK